ncbi:hypothetical protein PHLGIDRAFT_293653 [Phlebiopsis gigantea 11061_1 CR5-6]|uniref:Uncharacterized protein n=1 Tax=Phlebiopsis gigantea (strain 11061_1 CR5-6) TaxID=745531 RepID=A0A0C3S0F1_PHLG1|nr:hypothetical protein PHLGIDRAFT_293653 [Phlebiopsis gigantea 11061_1 CR5-6]
MGDPVRSQAFNLVLGVVLELVLYGMFLVTFAMSMYYLMQKPQTRKAPVNKLIASTGILLFGLITSQTVIEAVALFTPLLAKYANQDTAQIIDNANESYLPMIEASLALYFIELFVSNFLMVYRVWIVFQRNWAIIALPGAGLLVSIVCEGLFVQQNSSLTASDFDGVQFLTIALSCDVFTNIYCSALLAYKIWLSQRYIRGATTYLRSFSSLNVVIIIIESAALYTGVTFVTLVTYATNTFGAFTFLQLHCAVPGITYSLIIIRFGMGGAFKETPQLSTFTIPSQANIGARRGKDMDMQATAVNVHLAQKTESQSDVLNPSVLGLESRSQAVTEAV